ncbi:MAG: hypothetical protein A2566_00340 [Candidatus Zambryskibacteria bacterium RIFOXYD1_FULL_40_13]|uniref:Uncharacterized protein n=1 Tax=candidate division WWE3 bacterium GW2011_GWF2_42_42 TaxID=1619142 RepID=A0A0G1CM10_UNCKA|nr:MAG: hypothetical protein UT25_C0004G0053 [Parcubacteria group bacterium GW2011_GWC1_39_12]KKR19133.1 MAG: hypothetical protein UT49_C0003G0053 [Parcubacteria group bacterium GW2011_GWF1_39_37]KKR34748.1 MAG: hypothetical protein UT68_C0009G0004 [Parcubacteria group bacterium GW2011_GWC2_40_10]KKR51896.1 MAG: hypothetical protein UT89_C0005G0053 [Parcubacteria group bacterium GW2011_GWE1_40_20]KKS35784.1 MAG: hypothetical protein UU99_C0004G0053 [Parcubacteria group bacterium GW2011_GWE2_42_
MEGIPTTPSKEKSLEKDEFSGSKTLEEIARIQKGRDLSALSVKELSSIREKYIRLKQELNIGGKEVKEGMETSYEQAQEIMGESFYGTEEIKNTFGFEFPKEKIPHVPYTPEVLEKAKENGEMLVLRVESDGSGSSITMQRMNEIMQTILEKDSEEEQEKLLYDTNWYHEEDFFKNASLKTEWRIVGKEFIPDSTSKNYIEQTKILRDYLFGLESLSEEEKSECTDELLEGLQKMLDDDYDKNWQEVAKKLSELLVNKNHRRIPAEILYDWVLQFRNRKDRGILEENYDWSNTLSSDGGLVYVGYADRGGVDVGAVGPGDRGGILGVVSLR